MVINPEYLEQLRKQAQEVREDLERRQANATHEDIMAATDVDIVRKTMDNALVYKTVDDALVDTSREVPLFTDAQIDIIAVALADTRIGFRDAIASLIERVAALEAQVNTLLETRSIPKLTVMK
jgi:hypothetical protein